MCYGYQIWSEESLIQVYDDHDDDDLHGGQRSSGKMWYTMCYGYQTWSEESLIQEVKGHQRSNVVNNTL